PLERTLSRRLAEQQLEGAVHERALGGPGRRRFGQTIDRGELEREPAVLERRHLRWRERAGERKSHQRRRYSGGVTGKRTRSRGNRASGSGEREGPQHRLRHRAGVLEGTEVPEPGHDL